MGTDGSVPGLGWEIVAGERDVLQHHYQVIVSEGIGSVAKGIGLTWYFNKTKGAPPCWSALRVHPLFPGSGTVGGFGTSYLCIDTTKINTVSSRGGIPLPDGAQYFYNEYLDLSGAWLL